VLAQRLLHLPRAAEVRERIAQQAADQEFEAEIIDPLALGLVGAVGRGEPVVDNVIAQGQHRGIVPVMRLGRAFGLADTVMQGIENARFEGRRLAGQASIRAVRHALRTPL
jgi:hypothetical protein